MSPRSFQFNVDNVLNLKTLIDRVNKLRNPKDMAYFEGIGYHQPLDRNGTTLLHLASELDNCELVKFLLMKGFDVNHQNKLGRTPLLYAVKSQSVMAAELLLRCKADVLIKDIDGCGPLEIVAENEDGFSATVFQFFDVLQQTISSDQEIAEILLNSNWHMRHVVNMGNSEAARLMLEAGRSVHYADETFGNTLLHDAVRWRDLDMVKVLVSYGADVNAQNVFGEVPLGSLENVYHCPDIVEFLLGLGANLNGLTQYGRMQSYHLYRTGDVRCIEVMLKYCDVSDVDSYGETILHYVAMNKNPGVAELFDARSTYFRKGLDPRSERGMTPLHVAVECANVAFLQFLLKNYADVNALDENGCTPLYSLATIDPIPMRQECAQFLLDYGADVNLHSNLPIKTALEVALQCAYHDIASAILDRILCLDVLGMKLAEENKCAIDGHEFSREYYYPRLAELLSMTESYVYKKITFFDLMTYSPQKMVVIVDSQKFHNAFNASEYELRFPLYHLTLKRNVLVGMQKRNLLDSAG